MAFNVSYTSTAIDDLKNLSKKFSDLIIKKISYYSKQQDPLKFAKRLTTNKLKLFRFRIGNFRAVFRIDKEGSIQLLMILRVQHRKEVYRDL